MLRPRVELLEIIRRKKCLATPVESKPLQILFDGLDVLLVLFDRVGVVETKVTAPVELSCHAEVQADRLGVADVQIAIGLRRKPRHDFTDQAAIDIASNHVANEMAGRLPNLIVTHSL